MTSKNGQPAVDYSTILPTLNLRPVIKSWLTEDMPTFDVGGLVVGNEYKEAHLYLKSAGVFAGKPFVESIFEELQCAVNWQDDIAIEGTFIDPGSQGKIILATVKGPANSLLRGERTALNTLSRCSGVATVAYHAKERIKREYPLWNGVIAGTRKVTPGSFRIVEKYGLIVGGCDTHRLDLSQMTMLKDNHIWSCGGNVTQAVKIARSAAGFSQKIEVECQNLVEAMEAADAGADVVMLDNFSPEGLKSDAHQIKQRYPNIIIEASGGITINTMQDYVCDSVDVISRGDLTQGYSCLDYSLKIHK